MSEEITTTSLWVFGYGSLVWKPGFQPGQTSTGIILDGILIERVQCLWSEMDL